MDACKICGSAKLSLFAHTARCGGCDVLLCYPYPKPAEGKYWNRERALYWYTGAALRNHTNFSRMALYTIDTREPIDVLDYGGGGGQFALVCKSLFPRAAVYIVDISDVALLDEWRPLNRQIPFESFEFDETRFDVIFMNDVFEHLDSPVPVLSALVRKLKPGGRIFIDTPKQFWLYPFCKMLSKRLYTKLLRGTVDHDHLQIWSRWAFECAARSAGLKIEKYREVSEFTMPVSHYLGVLRVKNPLLAIGVRAFYLLAPYIARNKIMAVLVRK